MFRSYDIRFIVFLRDLKSYFEQELVALYSKEEVNHFLYILIEFRLHENRFLLAMQPDFKLSKKDYMYFMNACKALKNNMPIQYFLEYAYFGDLKLRVKEGVLIPRPETLELVSLVTEFVLGLEKQPAVLDIGTGSGCISISLSLAFPNAMISALDISDTALAIAAQNAADYQLKIAFEKADVLSLSSLNSTYDVIVSNPPYVRQLEKMSMQANVLDYEPDLALFVSDTDPLIFYKKIGELALLALDEGGALFFEINEYLGAETTEMLARLGYNNIQSYKDIYGKDRMLKAML